MDEQVRITVVHRDGDVYVARCPDLDLAREGDSVEDAKANLRDAIAALLIEITGSSATIVSENARLRPAKSEVEQLIADASLARELTGWTPGVPLREGLARTVEWLRDNRRRYRSGYTI